MAIHGLGRDISLVLLAKLAALLLLYFAFFNSSHRPHVSPADMSRMLLHGSEPAAR